MKKILFLFFLLFGFLFSYEFLGSRFIKDNGLPLYIKRYEIVPMGEGGIFQIYIKNNFQEELKIEGLKINDKKFEELDKWIFRNKIDVSKWWCSYPNPIPSGKTGTIRFRYYKILELGEKINLTIVTNRGEFKEEIELYESPLKLKFVGFDESLKNIYLFVKNQGDKKCNLLNKVYLNDKKVYVKWKKNILYPEEITLGEIELEEALKKGEYLIIRVISDIEKWEANGQLRVFPSRFYITGWMMGNGADVRDLKRIHFNLESNSPKSQRAKILLENGIFSEAMVIQDEPLGGGISPQEVAEKFLNAMKNEDIQYVMQLTGFGENLTYGDIADIHCHHHQPDIESDYVHKLNDPKQVWYLPQSTWQCWEGLDFEEKNKPRQWAGHGVDEQDYLTYESIGHGAKGLCWFIYCNLWNQSMNYWGGLEYDYNFPDPMIQGMISNPILWRKVEEINGLFLILSPYLKMSAPYFNEKKDGLSINCILCWNDLIVLTLINRNFYKDAGYIYLYDKNIEIPLPSWIKIKKVFDLSYFKSPEEVNFKKEGNKLKIFLPEIKVKKLLLLIPEGFDEKEIINKWGEISSYTKREKNDLKEEEISEYKKNTKWHYQTLFRNKIKVKSNIEGEDLIVKIPLFLNLNLKKGQILDENSLKVIEVDKNGEFLGEKKFYFKYSIDIFPKDIKKWNFAQRYYTEPKAETGKLETKFEDGELKIRKFSPFGPDYGCSWIGISFMDYWIPSEYPILRIKYNLEKTYTAGITVNSNFDINGDKKRDGGSGIRLWRETPPSTIEKDGMKITEWNWVESAKQNKKENPEGLEPKYGNFGIQTVYFNNSKVGELSEDIIKGIEVCGNNNLYILLDGKTSKVKERYLDVYYDLEREKKEEKSNFNIGEEIFNLGKLVDEKNLEIFQDIETPNIEVKIEKKEKLKIIISPDIKPEIIICKIYNERGRELKLEIVKEKNRKFEKEIELPQESKYIVIKSRFYPFIEKTYCFEIKNFSSVLPLWEEKNFKPFDLILTTYRPIYDFLIDDEKIIIAGEGIKCFNKNGEILFDIKTEAPCKQILKLDKNRYIGYSGRWEKETGNYKVSYIFIFNEKGEKLWEKSFSPKYVKEVVISPSGEKFAVSVWHEPKGLQSSIYIFNKIGEEIGKISTATYSEKITFLNDDTILVGTNPQGVLNFYKIDGKRIFSWKGKINSPHISDIKVFKDKIFVLSYNLYILDEKGKEIIEKECGIYPRVMDVSEDGKYVAVGTLDGTMSIFNIDKDEEKIIKFEDGIINDIKFFKDRVYFTVDRFSYSEDKKWENWVEIWEVDKGSNLIFKSKTEKRPFTDMAKIFINDEMVGFSSYEGKVYILKRESK